jgi:hypothetical protein
MNKDSTGSTKIAATQTPANSVRRSLLRGAGTFLAGGAVALPLLKSASSVASQGTRGAATYAAVYGVSGNNNGSVDDTPSLQTAYAAAVAAGSNALILPTGNVYLQSYTAANSYPYSYVLRVAVNDFQIVVPDGCIVYCTVVDDGQGGTTATNYWSLFQFTASRSGITGGGQFKHTVPGNTGTTPNNYVVVSHLTASSVDCYQTNLIANGFVPSIGVFDNSSSTSGFQAMLRVRTCQNGVVQSSTINQAGAIYDCTVEDYYYKGFEIAGARISAGNLRADDLTSFSGTTANGLVISSLATAWVNVVGIQVNGPYTTDNGQHNRSGILINPSGTTAGGLINVTNYQLQGLDNGINILGYPSVQMFTAGTMKYCSYVIDKSVNSVHCGDTYINGLVADSCYYGFSQNAGGAATEGLFYLCGAIRVTNLGSGSNANCWPATNSIVQNCAVITPIPPLASLYTWQRSTATFGVVAARSINNLTLEQSGIATALTIVFPANPVDGQVFTLRASAAVTTLTVSGTVASAPTTLAPGYNRQFVYDGTAAMWI